MPEIEHLGKDGKVSIQRETVDELIDRSGLSFEKIKEFLLPILKIDRGDPHKDFISYFQIYLARIKNVFSSPKGYGTYQAPQPVPGDPNTLRGLNIYIQAILEKMKIKYGLDLTPQNIVTSSNGGFLLENLTLDHLRSSGYNVGFANPTYNRAQEREKEMSIGRKGKMPSAIKEKADGIDLDEAEDFFKRKFPERRKAVLYLVPWGGNPNGSQTSSEKMVKLCQLAETHGGIIMADGAYMELYFNEKDRADLKAVEKYIKGGQLIIMNTATKEADRGSAFLMGSEELMGKILKFGSNTLIAPIYRIQGAHTYYYKSPKYEKFLAEKIRPGLRQRFSNHKNIIMEEGGMEFSNPDVVCGYNLEALLPKDANIEQIQQFFQTLLKLAIRIQSSKMFYGDENGNEGIRIPFGGFSAQENIVIAILVKKAYQKVFGKKQP